VSSVFHLQVAFKKNDISFSSKIVSYVRIKMHVPLLFVMGRRPVPFPHHVTPLSLTNHKGTYISIRRICTRQIFKVKGNIALSICKRERNAEDPYITSRVSPHNE
jgi:hypothetical protein